ncbi:hypothetical protein [Nitrobacter sp.]|uniref:hypothetical protein n=1 Tax=Nitrobacter sp. TaxID=29420 RepID=UPI0029CAB53D|nr:hypothetical protein [Nitrobacter sp.]
MSEYSFDNIGLLQRNRTIEGETGTELGLEGGITLIVLAATDANPRWKAVSEEVGRHLTKLANARAPAEEVRRFLAGIYAKTLVKGWRGVKSAGVEIPFSVEACTAFLLQAEDAYAAVYGIVYDTKNFRGARIEAIAAEAGNG